MMDIEKKEELRRKLKDDPDLANEIIQYIEHLEHSRNFLQSQFDNMYADFKKGKLEC